MLLGDPEHNRCGPEWAMLIAAAFRQAAAEPSRPPIEALA